VEYNNMMGEAHAYIRPTPLLSRFISDSIKKGRDVTRAEPAITPVGRHAFRARGRYRLPDGIKKLVYDDKVVTFEK